MPALSVHMLPGLLEERELPGCSAVVIDVLRATTTMIHALAHGAAAVVPCLTVEEALACAASFPADARLLGGERHGELIPGFDLGNSPLQYGPEVVRGKTIVFTTTNGTKALLTCGAAQEVLIGAFVNLSAIVQRLQGAGRDARLVCAGTDGQLTAEDILFAGAVAAELSASTHGWQLGNVQAQMAQDFYLARSSDSQAFRETFYDSLGARNLLELGMSADIERALQRDLFDCVPAWDAATGRVN